MIAKMIFVWLFASGVLTDGNWTSRLPSRVSDPLERLDGESHARVRELFSSFRDGTFEDQNRPPELSWEDAESLMIMAESTRRLTRFPVNPLSSQSQLDVCEGTLALWLLEQVRLDRDDYHSLNPFCLSKDGEGGFAIQSDENRPRLVEAYQEWWKKVAKAKEATAREANPLENTNLHWY